MDEQTHVRMYVRISYLEEEVNDHEHQDEGEQDNVYRSHSLTIIIVTIKYEESGTEYERQRIETHTK